MLRFCTRPKRGPNHIPEPAPTPPRLMVSCDVSEAFERYRLAPARPTRGNANNEFWARLISNGVYSAPSKNDKKKLMKHIQKLCYMHRIS